jgi:hypothetical protein
LPFYPSRTDGDETPNSPRQRPRRDRRMLIQTEAKAQGWRAVAVLEDGVEALLYVNRSSTQIRAGYAEAFFECFETDEERESVQTIKLQQWQGAPDAGKWLDKAELRMPIPTAKLVKVAA